MTFYATIAGTVGHVDLALALRIEGVPVALVERAIPAAVASSLSGYTQFVGITRLEEGESVLDLDERREIASTLEVELLDDAARTLAALFALNRRRVAWLATDETSAQTNLTVSTAAPFSAGQTIYLDGETITVGTVGAGVLNGCTRGAFGSTATPSTYGTASDGESIYTTPPAWRGRRAFLYGYALNANGGGFEQLLGVWIIDEPPRHLGDDAWALSLASVAQEYYERPIGYGLQSANLTGSATYGTSGGRNTWTLPVNNARAFRTAVNYPTYAICEGPSGSAIVEVQGVDTGAGTLTIYTEGQFGTPTEAVLRATTFRPFAVVGIGPQAVLYLLLSRYGQGATTYDRLPGRDPSARDDPGWRLGAGFATTEVDTSTTGWGGVDTSTLATLIVDEQRPVSDALREWCLLTGTATRVDSQGRLTVFSLATPRTTAATTLGPDSVVPDSRVEVLADEGAIYPLASVKCAYNPLSKEFASTINLIDVSLAKRYPRSPKLREFEFRSFGCNDAPKSDPTAPPWVHPGDIPIAQVPSLVSDLMRGDNGLARRLVRLTLTLAHLDLRIGDVVSLSGLPDAFSTLPDMRGGTLNGARCRVISRRPRYSDGRIDVQLVVLDPLLVVCPAATIASAVTTTLTLATTGDELSGATPWNDFFVGAGVRIYDISAGTSHATTVASINAGASQIVVTTAPGFVVQAGVDYVVLDPLQSSASGTSASGYTLSEMAIVVDNDGAAGAVLDVNVEPRWR